VPDAVAPDTVEFKLELGPNINWHKGIWVPTDVAGGGAWIEAHDDVRAKSTITVPSAVLGAGLSLRFQKAMFLGVITDLAGSKPLSDFPSLEAGSRITFTWVEDGGWRP
jgi:hypothetical protein